MGEAYQTVSFIAIGTTVAVRRKGDESPQTGIVWGVRVNSDVRRVYGQGDGNTNDVQTAIFYTVRADHPDLEVSDNHYPMWTNLRESDLTVISD
jgi:hypothetical protein